MTLKRLPADTLESLIDDNFRRLLKRLQEPDQAGNYPPINQVGSVLTAASGWVKIKRRLDEADEYGAELGKEAEGG